MSEMKFTPGPWQKEIHSLSFRKMFKMRFHIMAVNDRKRICYSETDNIENAESMEADAALIAAAPEMYAALALTEKVLIRSGMKIKICGVDLLQRIGKILEKAQGME